MINDTQLLLELWIRRYRTLCKILWFGIGLMLFGTVILVVLGVLLYGN